MTDTRTNTPEALERALRQAALPGSGGRRANEPAARRANSGPAGGDAAAQAAARLTRRMAGEGLADISYTLTDSPFGRLRLAATRRGLVRLAFPEQDLDGMLEGLAHGISPRIVEAEAPLDGVRRELEEYFSGRRQSFGVPLDWSLIGGFHRRVLRGTSEIPFGGVQSYAEVAADAGSPRGSRAAGNALGANPIPILIPCHRVLRSGGSLGGYGGGTERKRWLLQLEGAPLRAS